MSASISACDARKGLADNMPCVCDTFAAYYWQALSKHRTNPHAEIVIQSDALQLLAGATLRPRALKYAIGRTSRVLLRGALALGGCLAHPSTLPYILPAGARQLRNLICISVSLGRFSVRAAALSSIPACAPSPLPARNLHPLATLPPPFLERMR